MHWVFLLKFCKLLEGWFSGLSQLPHRLPLSIIHIIWQSLRWMAQNNSCSDVYSSSSSLVDLLSLWALTSFFLSVDSCFTTMSESTISWNCSLFTCPSFISFIFQTFLYLRSFFFSVYFSSSHFIANIAIYGTWSLFTCSSCFLIHTFLYLISVFSFMEVSIMLLQSLAMCP